MLEATVSLCVSSCVLEHSRTSSQLSPINEGPSFSIESIYLSLIWLDVLSLTDSFWSKPHLLPSYAIIGKSSEVNLF